MVLLILARLTNRPTPGLAIEGRRLPRLGPCGPLSSAPHGRPSPSGLPKRVLLTGAEVRESRQTTWMGQVLSRFCLHHICLCPRGQSKSHRQAQRRRRRTLPMTRQRVWVRGKTKICDHTFAVLHTDVGQAIAPSWSLCSCIFFLTGLCLLYRSAKSIQQDNFRETLTKSKVFFLLVYFKDTSLGCTVCVERYMKTPFLSRSLTQASEVRQPNHRDNKQELGRREQIKGGKKNQ